MEPRARGVQGSLLHFDLPMGGYGCGSDVRFGYLSFWLHCLEHVGLGRCNVHGKKPRADKKPNGPWGFEPSEDWTLQTASALRCHQQGPDFILRLSDSSLHQLATPKDNVWRSRTFASIIPFWRVKVGNSNSKSGYEASNVQVEEFFPSDDEAMKKLPRVQSKRGQKSMKHRETYPLVN